MPANFFSDHFYDFEKGCNLQEQMGENYENHNFNHEKNDRTIGRNGKNTENENHKNENSENQHLPIQIRSKKEDKHKEEEILEKEIKIKRSVFEQMEKYPSNATFEQKSALDRKYLQKCQDALNELRNQNWENHQKEIEAIENKPCCCFNLSLIHI